MTKYVYNKKVNKFKRKCFKLISKFYQHQKFCNVSPKTENKHYEET